MKMTVPKKKLIETSIVISAGVFTVASSLFYGNFLHGIISLLLLGSIPLIKKHRPRPFLTMERSIGCLEPFVLLRVLWIGILITIQNATGFLQLYGSARAEVFGIPISKSTLHMLFILICIWNNQYTIESMNRSGISTNKDCIIYHGSILVTMIHSVLFTYGLSSSQMILTAVINIASVVYGTLCVLKIKPHFKTMLFVYLTFWTMIVVIYTEFSVGTSVQKILEAALALVKTPAALVIILAYCALIKFLWSASTDYYDQMILFVSLRAMLIFRILSWFGYILTIFDRRVPAPFLSTNNIQDVLYLCIIFVLSNSSENDNLPTLLLEDHSNMITVGEKLTN